MLEILDVIPLNIFAIDFYIFLDVFAWIPFLVPQVKYVIMLQESGNLVENIEKSLRWRLFWSPVLIKLLVTKLLLVRKFYSNLDVFPFLVLFRFRCHYNYQ